MSTVKHFENDADSGLREHPPEVVALIRWLREPRAARPSWDRRRAISSAAPARGPDADREVA